MATDYQINSWRAAQHAAEQESSFHSRDRDRQKKSWYRTRPSGIRRGGKPTDHKGEIIIGFLAFVTIPSCTLATLNV